MGRPRGSRKQREQQARMVTGAGNMIGYVRVSTDGQAETGHSLDGQLARIHDRATDEGLQIIDMVQDVRSGAKQRDGLDDAWARVKAGEAEGIIFPKVDRLGRSMLHLAGLVAEAKDLGLSLLSADEGWQVKRGRLVNEALPFMVAMAEVERERISRRTKDGLAAVKASGKRLGRPVEMPHDLADRAVTLRRQGATLQAVATAFNNEGLRTPRGREFTPETVYRIVRRAERQE